MTRRSSVRAAARRNYCELAAGQQRSTPTPAPSPRVARARGGGEQGGARRTCSVQADPAEKKPPAPRVETKLTKRVRQLYEDSAVPVREVAAIAGVTERTLYKYVEKQNWKRRYRCVARDEAVARANRGRHLRPRPDAALELAPVKGAGGRFIRREDSDKPIAVGLKALDPAAARRAAALCHAAAQRAAAALAEAEDERMADERHAMWQFVNTQLDKLQHHYAQPENPPIGSSAPDAMRDMYWRNIMWACGVLNELLEDWRARTGCSP